MDNKRRSTDYVSKAKQRHEVVVIYQRRLGCGSSTLWGMRCMRVWAGCACWGHRQAMIFLLRDTHTIRAPASTSLGNFLMTPLPAADGNIYR